MTFAVGGACISTVVQVKELSNQDQVQYPS